MSKYLNTEMHSLNAEDRLRHYGHAGAVIWMTGLSASGKSTLSMALELELTAIGYSCYVLDGDNIRRGLNIDLGFGPEDRTENIRRVGEVAALFSDAGIICICAFISPYRVDRERARRACHQSFHEVYVAADLQTCEARDPKGLYKKARAGELLDFTGINAPYERPHTCEITLDTIGGTIEENLEKLVAYVLHTIPLSKYRGGAD